jgi:hypothetical protein
LIVILDVLIKIGEFVSVSVSTVLFKLNLGAVMTGFSNVPVINKIMWPSLEIVSILGCSRDKILTWSFMRFTLRESGLDVFDGSHNSEIGISPLIREDDFLEVVLNVILSIFNRPSFVRDPLETMVLKGLLLNFPSDSVMVNV